MFGVVSASRQRASQRERCCLACVQAKKELAILQQIDVHSQEAINLQSDVHSQEAINCKFQLAILF
jgi:hypothetical protein